MVLRTQEGWRTTPPYRSSDTQQCYDSRCWTTSYHRQLHRTILRTFSILWIRSTLRLRRTNSSPQESRSYCLSNPTWIITVYVLTSRFHKFCCRVPELHHVHLTGRNTSSRRSYDR